jgi:hypothetical protein
MAVYEDFFQYSSGVYTPNKASGLAGYMQARLIGYGTTTGSATVDYWIAATVRLPLYSSVMLLASFYTLLMGCLADLGGWLGRGWILQNHPRSGCLRH